MTDPNHPAGSNEITLDEFARLMREHGVTVNVIGDATQPGNAAPIVEVGHTRQAWAPDPLAQREETRRLLSSPEYRDVFNRVMVGAVDGLTMAQTNTLRAAQTATGTPPPGLPMPIGTEGNTL